MKTIRLAVLASIVFGLATEASGQEVPPSMAELADRVSRLEDGFEATRLWMGIVDCRYGIQTDCPGVQKSPTTVAVAKPEPKVSPKAGQRCGDGAYGDDGVCYSPYGLVDQFNACNSKACKDGFAALEAELNYGGKGAKAAKPAPVQTAKTETALDFIPVY
jgi:hypothetical protein